MNATDIIIISVICFVILLLIIMIYRFHTENMLKLEQDELKHYVKMQSLEKQKRHDAKLEQLIEREAADLFECWIKDKNALLCYTPRIVVIEEYPPAVSKWTSEKIDDYRTACFETMKLQHELTRFNL